MSVEFEKALARQGFRWNPRILGGCWQRTVDREIYSGTVDMATKTALLMLERESFPKYLNMEAVALQAFMHKHFDKHRPGRRIMITAHHAEYIIKPFMQALMEVS